GTGASPVQLAWATRLSTNSNQRRLSQQQRPIFRALDEVSSNIIAQSRFVSRPAPQPLVISRNVGCGIEVPLLQKSPPLSISAQRLAAVKSMRREIIDAPNWRAALDAVQFRCARLPLEHSFHVRLRTPLHFGSHVRRLHQSESLMPVRAAQDARIQHSSHHLERIPAPRPRASGRARSMAEGEGFRRLQRSIVSIIPSAPRSPGTQEFRWVHIIPRKTCAHAVGTMPDVARRRLARQVGIRTEQLNKTVVLEHVDCLQRPVVPCEVEVAVHIAAVPPVWRKPAYSFIDRAFLDP